MLTQQAWTLRAGEADAEQLLRDLQGDDFDLRQAAAGKLEALGEAARAALEKAARSGQPEVQATAAALLKKLENAVLAVAVYDRNGKPMANAEADVKLYFQQRGQRNDWSEPRNETLQTQANGRAELSNLTPGAVNIQFEWKKAVRDGSSYWNMDLQRGVNPLVLTLSRGAELKLKVLNTKGEPLRDATVTLYNNRQLDTELLDLQLSLIDQWDRSGVSATSDKDGNVHFESVNEGTYQAVGRADGQFAALGPVVTLRSGRVTEAAAITLQPRKAGKLQVALERRSPTAKLEEKPQEPKPAKKPEADPAKLKGGPEEPAKIPDAADAATLKKQRVQYDLEFIFEGPGAEELQKKQRQLRQTLNAYRNNESPETDEQGKLTLEDLKPGRYRLTIVSGTEAPWQVPELQIKAGETTDLGVLQNVEGGTVKGKILDADGKGVQYMNVTLTPESQEEEFDGTFRGAFGLRGALSGARSVQTQKDGAYEFKNVPPGRYVATTHTRKGQPVRVEGVVVEAGKVVEAVEARLPANAAGRGFNVKGTIKLPDGKPAAQATVNLHSATFGRWTRNADDKGQFDFTFSPEQGWTPTAVSVKAPNCKAAKVDLTAPGTKLEAVEIQLEKQDYGSLRIKVTDEAGVPLEGVLVRPRQARPRYNAFNQIIDRRVLTNKAGEARLSGLATGPRTFQLDLDGYFLPEPLTANVFSENEAEASVRMKRGLALRGRVEATDGLSSTIAVLSGPSTRTSILDENGRFEFKGLAPGDYSLSAAGPGMTSVERVKVTLAANAEPAEVQLKTVRCTGGVAQLPANSGFGTISLTRREKSADGNALKHFGNGFVDGSGRTEFWGVAPGEYDVLLNPATPMSVIAPYRTTNVRSVKSSQASLFAGKLTFGALKSYEELAALEGVKIPVPEATAVVSGSINIEPPIKNVQQNSANMSIRLVSEQASATVNFNFPSELTPNTAQRDPIVFGEKREQKAQPTVAPGAFKFTGLPPGEYKLFIEVMPYRYSVPGGPEKREKKNVPVQMVVIKPGEQVDLGAISFTPSADALEALRQTQDPNMDTEPEDQVPVFQP